MKVLVTGATGFIGRHRVKHLQEQGHEVIAVGNTSREQVAHTQIWTDLSEKGSFDYIVSRYRPDRIEHFASLAIVAQSRQDPWTTYKFNVLGAVNVFQTALKFNTPQVLSFTTDKVYGNRPIASETDTPVINGGAYEVSKTCQDIVSQSYHEQGVNLKIVRSCNVYGPNDPNRRIIPNTIRDLLAEKTPLVFSNIIGKRQYVYVKDLMSAIDTILNSEEWICNVATSDYFTQEQVVKEILASWYSVTGKYVEPIYKQVPDIKEIPEQRLRFERLVGLGWKPIYTFNAGIQEILRSEL